MFHLFFLQFLQGHYFPVFYTQYTNTVFLDYPIPLPKDSMSLTLSSFRTVAHASIIGRAPALPTRASKLSPTIFHLLRRSISSTVVQQKVPKAVTMPQKSLAHRVRQRYRAKQISAWPVNQQKPRKLAAKNYRANWSYQSWFWQGFHETFWPFLLLHIIYQVLFNRSVKTMGFSLIRVAADSKIQFGGRTLLGN
jgi:hypothetical protein